VQDSEPTSGDNREEIEKAAQAFFNQKGNVTDGFNQIEADVHRIVENPLPESTDPNVEAESLPRT
jgi:hypothetical protein